LEKVNDETYGAKWVDIDGSTSLVVGFSAGGSGREGDSNTADTTDITEGEGDDE
jgi:hypothetical protein